MEFIQVQITFPTMESAKQVVRSLVEQHLAACVQIAGKVRSTYIWDDEIETSEEVLLLAKTRGVFFEELVEVVCRQHPYVCPQIVALPIVNANTDYIKWMDEQLKKTENIP
ncbi:MAG: divalent-cation tolerance protein CutA [Planctomycetaceae bacterium]|jgi:periplasmic divalent cation tolerance protein|nr:divalent-cation tolerance protein CutA [Planctomycetaceae bacterium]